MFAVRPVSGRFQLAAIAAAAGDGFARVQRDGDIAFAFKDYSVETFAAMTGWDLALIEGVRHEECNALYLDPAGKFSR